MADDGTSHATLSHPLDERIMPDSNVERKSTVSSGFATRAQARFLDSLGWDIAPSPRRDVERHAPLQCCFVLRDGGREEAAFGYTGLSTPHGAGDAGLRDAQAHVASFLGVLGEARGLLIQNRPLIAFDGRSADRIVVFGGWRFDDGRWSPFLLGPDGLGGVSRQATLFASETSPMHMVAAYGHPSSRVLPQLVAHMKTVTGGHWPADVRLRLEPFSGAWSLPVLDVATPPVRIDPRPPAARVAAAAPSLPSAWEPEADEFRFHALGMDCR